MIVVGIERPETLRQVQRNKHRVRQGRRLPARLWRVVNGPAVGQLLAPGKPDHVAVQGGMQRVEGAALGWSQGVGRFL